MAHDKLLRKETECQLCINELDRKIERQQQRLQEILERGKRETSEIARLGLAEQYAQGERKVMRLLEQRKTFVQAKEIVEVQLADFELQAAIPQSIFELNRPESQRERALVDVLRSRIKQTHEDMLSSLEGSTLDNQIDNHERASIQAALDLFDRERDEEIRVTLRAIEDDLNLDNTASLFSQPQRARETE
jgi:hypothetical protein